MKLVRFFSLLHYLKIESIYFFLRLFDKYSQSLSIIKSGNIGWNYNFENSKNYQEIKRIALFPCVIYVHRTCICILDSVTLNGKNIIADDDDVRRSRCREHRRRIHRRCF